MQSDQTFDTFSKIKIVFSTGCVMTTSKRGVLFTHLRNPSFFQTNKVETSHKKTALLRVPTDKQTVL